jgi:hypothetical protein
VEPGRCHRIRSRITDNCLTVNECAASHNEKGEADAEQSSAR